MTLTNLRSIRSNVIITGLIVEIEFPAIIILDTAPLCSELRSGDENSKRGKGD